MSLPVALLLRGLFLLALLGATWGCATYPQIIQEGVTHARAGQWSLSQQHFEQLSADENDRNRLAYLMEWGSVLQASGDYQKSSQIFDQAHRLSDQMDYISISNVTMATLGSEEMIQYQGESFEKLMINAMSALNYMALQNTESALVEARRIDLKIKRFRQSKRDNFEFNPFATYLSAILYESEGNWDSAFIEYKRTFDLTHDNPFVVEDLNRMAPKAQRLDRLAAEKIPKPGSSLRYQHPECLKKKDCGELLVFYLYGLGPQKTFLTQMTPILTPSTYQAQHLRCDFPLLPATFFSTLSIYNIEQVAIQTLAADQAAYALRRIGARVAKEVVAEQIRQKNEGLGQLALLAMILSDRADLRQWRMLPAGVGMARLQLPVGEWELNCRLLDRGLGPLDWGQKTLKTKINKNKFSFLLHRTFN